MAEKSFDSLLAQIKESPGKHPLLLIHGENLSQVNQLLTEITNLLIPAESRDGNFLFMGNKQFKVNEVIDFCDTLPFLSPRRVLVVENCPLLMDIKKKGSQTNMEGEEEFLKWLKKSLQESPSYVILFVFYEDGEKVNLNISRQLYKLIAHMGIIHKCSMFKEIFGLTGAYKRKEWNSFISQLNLLLQEGIEPEVISYRLMSMLRKPLKDEIIKDNKDFSLMKAYLTSLETEDRLRPRSQDLFSENPQFVLEEWILKQSKKE